MVYGDKKNNGYDLNKSINTERLEGNATKVQAKTEMLDLKNIVRNGSENADIEIGNNREKELELHCQPSTSGIQKQYAVCVRSAYKSYGFKRNPVVVLDGLNMTVPKGTIYGMLGASGCGKTTLLNCILGRKQLNGGAIWVLGGTPGSKCSGVSRLRIGYMPQENAVYGEFTVLETLVFFGWIAGMTTEKIQERSKFLLKLLMLSHPDEMVKNLSGGQQRRLSLAAALLHEPELLILDEPTVGLDPFLRETIWNHFLDITSDGQTTVIFTTHYMDETRRAHRIALMRGGYFLAEESPGKLLVQYGAKTLEEVFLKLSTIQTSGYDQRSDPGQEVTGVITEFADTNVDDGSTIEVPTDGKVEATDLHADGSNSNNKNNSLEDFSRGKISISSTSKQKFSTTKRGNHIKALFWKNCLWIMRNVSFMLFILVIPFLEAALICVSFGRNPVDLSVAVVNYETNNSLLCDSKLICSDSQLSCHYLNYLKKRDIILIPYDTEEDATESVLRGKTYASIVVKSNYSAALHNRVQDWLDPVPSDIASSEIDVVRDVSQKFIATHLKTVLYNTFKNFIEDYMASCNMGSKWLTSPIRFENPVYGAKIPNFTDFAIPGLLLFCMFTLPASVAAITMLSERREDLFERLLVLGIGQTEFFVSHLVCHFMIMVVQAAILLSCVFALFNMTMNGSLLLVAVLTLLAGLCGMCFGLCASCICTTEIMAIFVVAGSTLQLVMMSGIIWPVQGLHSLLKLFAPAISIGQATESMRSIIQKDWGISEEVVYRGFLLFSIWTIIFLAISALVLKFKKD